jgi:hypothetical protein
MPTQGAQFAPACHVPELDGVVIATRGQHVSIRREGDGVNTIRVSELGEDCQLALILGERDAEARAERSKGNQNSFHH